MTERDSAVWMVAVILAEKRWHAFQIRNRDLLPFNKLNDSVRDSHIQESVPTAERIVGAVVPEALRSIMQELYWENDVEIGDPVLDVLYDKIDVYEGRDG